MKHVFILGNKRSGTSVLSRVLSSHPGVYIAPEADIAWMLFCRANGLPVAPYPFDGDRGFRQTVERYAAVLDQARPFAEIGDAVLASMARESGKDEASLIWIGDKKPTQHADPEVFEFLCTTYPDARFVHIVRHPAEVVRSIERRASTHGVDAVSLLGNLFDFWAQNEERVIEHKRRCLAPIHTLRYADLVNNPDATLSALFAFLDLSPSDTAATLIARERGTAHAGGGFVPERARRIVDFYGLRSTDQE